MKGLLVAATDCEPQYITRLLQVNHGMFTYCTSFVSCLFIACLNCYLSQSKMRIGLAEKTVQMALGQAAVYSDKNSSPPKVQSPFEEVTLCFVLLFTLLYLF